MRTLSALTLLGLVGCVATPQEPWDPRWKKVWEDEFDGAAGTLDAEHWNPDIGGDGWGNNQLEFNTDRPENASVDGSGMLRIQAIREDYEGNTWTSARLTSRDRHETGYGRYEARIQIGRAHV